ncbi:hypothetical protein GCM10020001_081160 [Nonomuraea salmonea]
MTTLVLDGGLATQLESLGADLRDELWSARLLLEEPELIRRAHACYFAAGADVATTASYQATLPGFERRGLGAGEAERLLRLSVKLAAQARDEHGRGLVAASVGPYGAYLANGAEYTGDYDLDEDGLYAWHRPPAGRSSRRPGPTCWPARPSPPIRRRGRWPGCWQARPR